MYYVTETINEYIYDWVTLNHIWTKTAVAGHSLSFFFLFVCLAIQQS